MAADATLVFSKTAGYRHDSIPAGIVALRELLDDVDATEDSAVFTDGNLARYRVVVFLNTSGDVFDDAGRAAFERFIRSGGGFVGVHGATNTEYEWPFYGQLVGAWFDRHPAVQQATVRVEVPDHPATAGIGPLWTYTDEWYDFRTNPRPQVRVLVSLDESSYTGGGMGADHPWAWCHERLGGRSFYTAGGHTDECYADPMFRRHLEGGIRWAAGLA